MNMKSPFPKVGLGQEKGFTLIELIMVIVLLGILAAVAIPRYQDLRAEAAQAACDGVFGAVQGAAAINFATRLITPGAVNPITSGARLASSLEGGAPNGWNVGAGVAPALSTTIGTTQCTIDILTSQTANAMATFSVNF